MPANRLQQANGAWGSLAYSYDATGNRTQEVVTPATGSPETRQTSIPATSNGIASVTGGGSEQLSSRTFTEPGQPPANVHTCTMRAATW